MNKELSYIQINDYTTQSGFQISTLQLSYQLFGLELGTAPVVLVNHALTANSNVVGENGWWKEVIGNRKTIDTKKFTVLGTLTTIIRGYPWSGRVGGTVAS